MFVVITWGVFIQYLLNNNKKFFNKTLFVKKQISCKLFKIPCEENFKNDVIYLNILKKIFYLNRNTQSPMIYNCSVLSESKELHNILQECIGNLIDSNDIFRLIQQHPVLKNLQLGQVLSCLTIDQKKIECLIWGISPREIHIYKNVDTDFIQGIIKVLKKSNDGLFYTILFIGRLNKTFIDSARHLGLEENCVIDVVQAFRNQLNFQKLHQGDRFSVLVSVAIPHDQSRLRSKLIGARLHTLGKDYYIFRGSNNKFYNKEGIRLDSNFIHCPVLKPYRISSNFNLNRLNPVTGQVSPHSGVDFAIPIGTPVFSVGDGEVIISKYSKIAGNYLGIRHNCQCVTRYMHLNKILVKLGQKVKQGDRIALSGNTGRSTGPHLHFEVWVNNHPINPLTANIVDAKKMLGNKERIKYLNQINEIIPKLSFD